MATHAIYQGLPIYLQIKREGREKDLFDQKNAGQVSWKKNIRRDDLEKFKKKTNGEANMMDYQESV